MTNGKSRNRSCGNADVANDSDYGYSCTEEILKCGLEGFVRLSMKFVAHAA